MSFIVTNNGVFRESELVENGANSEQIVYEVFRIVDGIPLFLEDHFARLIRSNEIAGLHFEMKFDQFRSQIIELATLNQKSAGNVKFEFFPKKNENRWSFRFIAHHYPTPDDYRIGVSTDLLFAERENPNAKVIQHMVRTQANWMIESQKLYEVLLVDRDGLITEGSRSNVFFVKGDAFYTAPESKVLVGITRQKVLDCLDYLGCPVREEAVEASRINEFDAAFLTGTSPKVLPIRSIGNQVYGGQPDGVRKLMSRYDQLIELYINKEKNPLK